ncbi:MAG: hypothetical protein QOF58_4026 [Pseudonocardiales bacterium]|nr:hypothetical protein [Pseudonocardiales bacterium]
MIASENFAPAPRVRRGRVREVADSIALALRAELTDEQVLRDRVEKLATAFPLYPHLQGAAA